MESLFRYASVTLLNYFIIIVGTYVLVDRIKIASDISYFIVISTVYIFTYFAYLKYVFKAKTNSGRVLKFSLALIIFWFLNNLFFSLMTKVFNLQYMLAVVFNILFLGAIRYIVYKNIVFKDGK